MQNIKFILKFIKYYLTAKTRFEIHSPFLFELVSNVFGNRHDNIDYIRVESLKRELLKDARKIRVHDLGAGSLVNKSDERFIKQIAKNSSRPTKYGRLLYRFSAYFKPITILELGTSLGISSAYMALGSPASKIITIEGSSNIAEEAKENFLKLGLSEINVVTGNFDNVLPSILESVSLPELIFIDGNHRREPTINYFNQCLSKVVNETVIIFDDIHWSDEMSAAWSEIHNHPSVTLSVDIFFMGFIFFRKELTKQHYVIRF
ncbi:MAG: SAM-dependent methyltransferase [Bacteroidetes bacterium]|nr:SAM-dependent methyltransferase [Bacteroidota bacterium]